jgi:hypothetical protein
MAQMLLNLRHVPEDEAREVRDLLNDHELLFYETEPSMWGISAGAIWLSRDEDLEPARQLMARYQAERGERKRAQYNAEVDAGTAASMGSRARQHPLGVLATLIVIAGLLFMTLIPFLTIA